MTEDDKHRPDAPLTDEAALEIMLDREAGVDTSADAGEEPDRPFFRDEAEAAEWLRGNRGESEPVDDLPDEGPDDADDHAAAVAAEFTAEDLQAIRQHDAAAQAFGQAYRQFEQDVKAADLENLQRTDPDRYAAVKHDLEERARQIADVANRLAANGQAVQGRISERKLVSENQRLVREVPELAEPENRVALRSWLIERGFSETDVDAVQDARLVALAWRSYKADQPAQPKPGRKVPVYRKNRSNNANIVPLAAFEDRRGQPATLRELERNLRQTGRIDDGVALLRARRQGGTK